MVSHFPYARTRGSYPQTTDYLIRRGNTKRVSFVQNLAVLGIALKRNKSPFFSELLDLSWAKKPEKRRPFEGFHF